MTDRTHETQCIDGVAEMPAGVAEMPALLVAGGSCSALCRMKPVEGIGFADHPPSPVSQHASRSAPASRQDKALAVYSDL